MKKIKKGFTLVELLVTVVIISILGTIGFISFLEYTSYTNDAKRKVEVGLMGKGLSLLKINMGHYPEAYDINTPITYNGALAFNQGILGESIINQIGVVSDQVFDPKYYVNYTYSTTSDLKYYEIGYINEFADSEALGEVYGDYNGILVIAYDGINYYLIPSPSITLSDIFSAQMTDLTTMGDTNYVFAGRENIPSTYNSKDIWKGGLLDFPTGELAYVGTSLPETETAVLNMMLKVKEAYSNSSLSGSEIGKTILSMSDEELIESGKELLLSTGAYPSENFVFRNDGIEAFDFISESGVQLGTFIESNEVSLTGVDATGEAISIEGGEYSINGGAYTSGDGTVNEGDLLRVKLLSSSSKSTTTSLDLSVGRYTTTFSVTTHGEVSSFSFIDKIDVPRNEYVESEFITISGGNPEGETISIEGGEYSINGGAYTSGVGSIKAGDQLIVRLMSSNLNATTTSTTVTIGALSGTFSITTYEADPVIVDLGGSESFSCVGCD